MEEYTNPEQAESNGPLRPLLRMLANRFDLAEKLQDQIDQTQFEEIDFIVSSEADHDVRYSDASFIKRETMLGINVDRVKLSPGQRSRVFVNGIESDHDDDLNFNLHIIRPAIEPKFIEDYQGVTVIEENSNDSFLIYYEYLDDQPDECYWLTPDSVNVFNMFDPVKQDQEIEQKLSELFLDFITSPEEEVDQYDEHVVFADRVINDISKLHLSPYR